MDDAEFLREIDSLLHGYGLQYRVAVQLSRIVRRVNTMNILAVQCEHKGKRKEADELFAAVSAIEQALINIKT